MRRSLGYIALLIMAAIALLGWWLFHEIILITINAGIILLIGWWKSITLEAVGLAIRSWVGYLLHYLLKWVIKRPIWILIAILFPGRVRGLYKRLLYLSRQTWPTMVGWFRKGWKLIDEKVPPGPTRVAALIALVLLVAVGGLSLGFLVVVSKLIPTFLVSIFWSVIWPVLTWLGNYAIAQTFRIHAWKNITRGAEKVWEIVTPPQYRLRWWLWRREKMKWALRKRNEYGIKAVRASRTHIRRFGRGLNGLRKRRLPRSSGTT